MARLIKPLTAVQVQNAKPKDSMYKMFDGGGLFLQVNPSGGKYWKMKYRKADGKEGLLTFGGYPEISLEQARRMRDEARAQRASGLDPGIVRQEEKAERRTRASNTFEAVSREWMEVHATKVKAQTLHIYRVLLEKSVFPLIGKRPIAEMKAPDFLALLRRLEEQKQLYSVKRISIVCGMIMRFAVAAGKAEADPTPALRGSLKAHKTKHLAAMTDPKQVGRLLRTIDAYPGSFVVSTALKIAPYVFVRPGELQHARWEDIDFDACEWRYTTSKTNTPHIVPLVPQVMKLLQELYAFTGEVVIYDLLGCFQHFCAVREANFVGVLGSYALALVNMEHIVVTQEGNFLLFARLFVFGFDPLPEDDHMGLLALADASASLLALLEGQVFAGTAQEHLIEEAVRLAGRVGDCFSASDPRLFPRDDAVFHLVNDSGGDFSVNIHVLAPFLLRGARNCGRISLLPGFRAC